MAAGLRRQQLCRATSGAYNVIETRSKVGTAVQAVRFIGSLECREKVMERRIKKLSLKRETVRNLTAEQLRLVRGGVGTDFGKEFYIGRYWPRSLPAVSGDSACQCALPRPPLGP